MCSSEHSDEWAVIGRENRESQQLADMAAMGTALVGSQTILGQMLDCRDWLVPWDLQRGPQLHDPIQQNSR